VDKANVFRAFAYFRGLFDAAHHCGLVEPTAMTLATATPDGRPSARTVLLKQFDARGFVFYTNTLSRKGRELKANPRAALCFYWQPLKEQVHVEGAVESVTAEEADEYWVSRPRESQVGAWASRQSEPLESRSALLARAVEVRNEYAAENVPRPPHWSGYRLVPERIEFWTAGEFRLHHRELYERDGGQWTMRLLNP
jgi:pyridoxamine 5'-phosphate oxidase